jgi:hypothetical protein
VSNTYCVVFFTWFSSSCVPYVHSFSELSIFECPFGIIQRLFIGRTFAFGAEGKGFDFNSGCCNTYKQICDLNLCNNERHDRIKKIVKKRLKMPKG